MPRRTFDLTRDWGRPDVVDSHRVLVELDSAGRVTGMFGHDNLTTGTKEPGARDFRYAPDTILTALLDASRRHLLTYDITEVPSGDVPAT